MEREGFPRIDERQNAQTAEAQSILISKGRKEEESQGARYKIKTQKAEADRKDRLLQSSDNLTSGYNSCNWSQMPAKELQSTVRR